MEGGEAEPKPTSKELKGEKYKVSDEN